MPIKLGMVMDSIGHINIKKDTSFAIVACRAELSAFGFGHRLCHFLETSH